MPTDLSIHQRRRQDLMYLMRDGIAVIPNAPVQARNSDVFYPYRADSDFYYLTHFPEPESVAVLAPGRVDGDFILFCRERDADQEAWDGARAGLEGAREIYGATQSYPISALGEVLPNLLHNCARVFAPLGRYADFDNDLIDWIRAVRSHQRIGVHAPGELVDLGHLLHEMRVIKKKDECQLMRRAAKISANGHCRAMQCAQAGLYEYQVQAEMERAFFYEGARACAYPSIVASGANACTLHYIDNRRAMQDGELLLIDAGAELDCYAADITRTFPVNGKFTSAQRAVYEVVLCAQKAAIDAVVAERTVNDYHQVAGETLTDGLIELGILRGERNELIERGAHRRFTMHRAGHWLGMDVHDVGDYKIDDQWRTLEAGMVLTVEPGLYFPPDEDIDEQWRNIGVRIEDDVLVTRDGNEVLSRDAPKEVDEIETLMAR